MKALWQIKMFKKFGKKILLFIDEPYLGCFGSAYTPITKEGVVKVLTELTQAVKTEGVLTGVHCCGNTDWSIFTDTVDLDIINFDAFAFFDRLALYGDNLKGFFDRGGILCWGIVPTNEFDPRHTADTLTRKIKEGINTLVNKGLRKELLTENLLISPACGLGTLSAGESEKILQKLSEISLCIRKTL
jgi:methionine synthase II (cobalamin-independent)